VESSTWNSLISKLPNPHFLQTYEWGQVKAKYGWNPLYAVWDANGKWKVESDLNLLSTFHSPVAAALFLKRQILRNGFAERLSVLYSPKGPLLDWTNESLRKRVLDDLQSFAKKQGAIFLKVDPDVVLGTGVPQGEEDVIDNGGQAVMSELKRRGWEYASDQIQFKNTVLIDLHPTEEEMLARMKQKTRYNVRLAEKKGIALRVGTLRDLVMKAITKQSGNCSWQEISLQSLISNPPILPMPNLSSLKWMVNPSPRSLSSILPGEPIMSTACRATCTAKKCRPIFCNGMR
jgi:lipid II:glycine glycyltransferase (peptidoglycan interpeptide bridge formation enzyme)